MPEDASITHWLQNLKKGSPEAAQELWSRYFQKLVALAGGQLPAYARRDFDEEDVALSAFHSLLSGVRESRFPQLQDRHDLWSLLVVITRRKAQAYRRYQTRLKRGGGQVLGESAVAVPGADAGERGFDALISKEPTPAFAVQAAEECQRLLNGLGDETLRVIAVLKMQSYTVEEIAERMNSTKRTIERRLQIIRKIWAAAAEEGAP